MQGVRTALSLGRLCRQAFCLMIAGDSQTSRRLPEALLGGCIPVCGGGLVCRCCGAFGRCSAAHKCAAAVPRIAAWLR